MALMIRMRQQGRNNRPFYRVVLTDSRNPRDGKYLEQLGWYNPFETEADKHLSLDASRIDHWLKLGAEISDNVKSLVKKTAPEIIKSASQREVLKRNKNCARRKAAAKKA